MSETDVPKDPTPDPRADAGDPAVRPGDVLRALSAARGATLPDFSAPPPAAGRDSKATCEPDLQVLDREGGARIRVRCECGRTVEIDCDYPDG